LILISPKGNTKLSSPQLCIANQCISASHIVKNLGFMIDSHLTMDTHVNRVCAGAYRQLFALSKLRKFLDQESLEKIMHAFVTTRLDYCNALFCGASKSSIKKLQMVQNTAARILTQTRKYDHIITPVLKQLHWLPVDQRIKFKILTLVFKCVHGIAPSYLQDLINFYHPVRDLQSSELFLLSVPFTNSAKVKNCAFSVAGPILFNSLPLFVRSASSLSTFKKLVKTHLFNEYFN
jgi:hypothetical protein